MSCEICGGRLEQIPAIYPTFWCMTFGHLVLGTEEGVVSKTPLLIDRLSGRLGECLRDDRSKCFVWEALKSMSESYTFLGLPDKEQDMPENELLDLLCREVGPVEDGEFVAEAAAGVPVIVTVFTNIVLARLKAWGCENKDEILGQAGVFIDRFVKNSLIAGMMKASLQALVSAVCG